jgi:phytanoyl-CoA hydroxylase
MAYWPSTPDTRTATFSLALDSTTRANGCLRFIPGSQLAQTVRPHKPVGKSRDDAHAIAIAVDEAAEVVEYVEVARGDVSVHDEWVVHGSAGNTTSGHRRTYVLAFRTADTVARERAAGFTHSHEDKVNWDSFNSWQLDSTGGKRV